MRIPILIAGGLFIIGLTVAAAPSTSDSQAVATTVEVHVECAGSRVSFWVEPWTVSIAQGDDVDWHLEATSTANSISVSAKRGGNWPFAGSPVAGTKANPARSGGAANRAGRHGYNITLQCDKGGPTVVIDPDIVIN